MSLRHTPSHAARGGSFYADEATARDAVDLARPMLEAARLNPAICGTASLCVVIMDPAMQPGCGASFDDAVLLEEAIGDRSLWDADYAFVARAKARCAWRHQQDGKSLQGLRAHQLSEGDSLLRGAVCRDGIVVAVSGALPWYDEAMAATVAACLQALADQRCETARAAGAATAGN
jgi:hypothetical protein